MNNFSNILFIANFDSDDASAFELAIKLALANQAKLTIAASFYDLKANAPVGAELLKALIEERQNSLNELVEKCASVGLEVDHKSLSGRPFIDIINEVLEFERDLVIKPIDHVKGIHSVLFGGTDMKLLRKCPCPVWLIKSAEQVEDRQIMVALDYDPENSENETLNIEILETAISLALAEFSELHIVHAWRLQHEGFLRSPRVRISNSEVDDMVKAESQLRRAWLSKITHQCLLKHGVETEHYLKPRLHCIEGDATTVVPGLAKKIGAELVVMGTVGRTGIPGYLMGNTAETILKRIETSVLAIKPEGFICPLQPISR